MLQLNKIAYIYIISIAFCGCNQKWHEKNGMNAILIANSAKSNYNCDSVTVLNCYDHSIIIAHKGDGIFHVYSSSNCDPMGNIELLDQYYNRKQIGIDLFSNHCAQCHEFYPDIKNNRFYSKIDSTNFEKLYNKIKEHQNIPLTSIEINCIKVYLRISPLPSRQPSY